MSAARHCARPRWLSWKKPTSELSKLTDLDLSRTEIQGRGLVHLANIQGLELLVLAPTAITPSALNAVRASRGIHALKLASTPIDDTAVEHLKTLTSLKRMDLSATNLTPAGMAELRKVLPGCDIVQYAPEAE